MGMLVKKWTARNTLRKQIFLGFMLAMVIVLSAVGVFVYHQVSNMLLDNAERHIQQTAAQAMGKMEVLLDQVSTFTTQVVTHTVVQDAFEREADGRRLSFEERQVLQQVVRSIEAYMSGVRSVELYTEDYRRLMPLTDDQLDSRVPKAWIRRVDEAKGQLVWLDLDPRYPDVVLAMRRVRLMDRSFSYAGYVLVQMEKRYFQLKDEGTARDHRAREHMALMNEQGQVITADFPLPDDEARRLLSEQDTISLADGEYLAVRQRSPAAGWHIVILTPVAYSTESLSVLRTVVIVSVVVGTVIFFIVTYILSGMISRPILNLIKAMRTARFGALRQISVSSSMMEINELNYTYNEMVRSLKELNEKVYQKEILQSRTELKALQAQINPHFLFNTLEAFYWALEDKGEEELAKTVVAMSGLFRYVISRKDEDVWVTIGDELDHAERYLMIMKMRMMDKLNWQIEVDEPIRRVPIPKLLIQPLVENAILHGIEQRLEPGTVILRVKADQRPGCSRIEVLDDGPGMDEETIKRLYEAMDRGVLSDQPGKGTGMGLVNVERRLRLYYGLSTDGLDIQSQPGKGTKVAFVIPNQRGRGTNEDNSDRG